MEVSQEMWVALYAHFLEGNALGMHGKWAWQENFLTMGGFNLKMF